MKKKDLKYYIFIVLVLISIIIFETMKPKQIDWRFTLEQKDKIPYGTYVLFNTIKDIFPEKQILVNKKTTWEFRKKYDPDSAGLKNYLYIAETFTLDKSETETLLNLAKSGNNVFISARNFGKTFSDTLNFELSYSFFLDSVSELNFYNPNLKSKKSYIYKKSAGFSFFSKSDTVNCEVLAHDKKKNIVFFRQKFGKGFFYISSVPEVFTNYAMITEKNYAFAYKMLSYLPIRKTVWDDYYKPFRKQSKTSLSFLLSEKSLKAAYYTLLLTVLFFVFFTAKRKQRIIPTIKPYENKTKAFILTLSGLYHKSKNHKDIALKRFTYFNNFIKTKYNVNLIDNEGFDEEKAAQKTGTDIGLLKKLLSYHTKINKLETISQEELIRFNKILEEIKAQCK